MGLNLVLMRQPASPGERWSVANTDWWDDDKFAGDREFDAWHARSSRAVYEQDPSPYGDGSVYWRPANILASKFLVVMDPTFPDPSWRRLLDLLIAMERDPSLWLYSSV